MARYKPNIGKIKTLEDANLALKEIGLLEQKLKQTAQSKGRSIVNALPTFPPCLAHLPNTTARNCLKTANPKNYPSANLAIVSLPQSASKRQHLSF